MKQPLPARAEGNQKAENSFDTANKVEKIHHKLFQAARKDLEAGTVVKDSLYYLCQVCGYTVEGGAPERCPVCGAPRSRFKKME